MSIIFSFSLSGHCFLMGARYKAWEENLGWRKTWWGKTDDEGEVTPGGNWQVTFLINQRGQDEIAKADSGRRNQYKPLETEGLTHKEEDKLNPDSNFLLYNIWSRFTLWSHPWRPYSTRRGANNWSLLVFDVVSSETKKNYKSEMANMIRNFSTHSCSERSAFFSKVRWPTGGKRNNAGVLVVQ